MDNNNSDQKPKKEKFSPLSQDRNWKEMPKSIKDIFSQDEILKSIAIKKIHNSWEVLVGPILADHSFPKDIQGNSLIVQTSHSAYSQEILFHSHKVLEYSKKVYGKQVLTKLHCVIGNIPTPKKKKLEKKEGSLEGKGELLESIQGIEDKNLKEKLTELIKFMD